MAVERQVRALGGGGVGRGVSETLLGDSTT